MPVFATLTPANPAAKLGFSTLVNQGLAQAPQNVHYQRFCHVDREASYRPEVGLFCEQSSSSGGSGSDTEPDERTVHRRNLDSIVWTGYFTFDLDAFAAADATSWFVGTGSAKGGDKIQFRMPFPPGLNISPKLRSTDARFRLDSQTGHLAVHQVNHRSGGVFVNGQPVLQDGFRTLNAGNATRIVIGPCAFDFAYTNYGRTDEFLRIRNDAVKRQFKHASETLHWTPTPAIDTLTINSYTLHTKIASGTTGAVYSASNEHGDTFAVKVVQQSPQLQKIIQREVTTLQEIRNQFKDMPDYRRLLHLLEVVPANVGHGDPTLGPMSAVYFISTPLVSQTLADVIASGRSRAQKMCLFREAIQGVALMHSKDWVHRDLKPENIGATSTTAVILDLGTAVKLPSSKKIQSTPGHVGTIPYLAPEMEWESFYDTGVDVWALGVVGYRLLTTHGRHPWSFRTNPWSTVKGEDNDRSVFHGYYKVACDYLAAAGPNTIEELVLHMLRFGWSKVNQGNRITLAEALRHQGWREFY